jgi:uncharacterized protein
MRNSLCEIRIHCVLQVLFDAQIHPHSVTDSDLRTLVRFDVKNALLVSDASAHPSTPDGLAQHFDSLLTEVRRFRAGGIKAWAALGIHPLALPRRGLDEVLEAVPARCTGGLVSAWGLTGLFTGSTTEEHAVAQQLDAARSLRLPVVLTVSAKRREPLTRRLLAMLKASRVPAGRVLVSGATGTTAKLIRECGHWVGLTLQPEHLDASKAVGLIRTLGPERLVLGSGAGSGGADLVALARAKSLLKRAGLSDQVQEAVCQMNAATWLEVRVDS